MSDATPDTPTGPRDTPGLYSIGSTVWPGTSRVIEEAGEVVQVLGKLIGAAGATSHWDGTNLADRVTEEVADAWAALAFFIDHNLDADVVHDRAKAKQAQYEQWHDAGLSTLPDEGSLRSQASGTPVETDKARP